MSLDVYLRGPAEQRTETHRCADCEHTHEHTYMMHSTLFQANITHNLGTMAEAAGIYHALWVPESLTLEPRARDLISLLEVGLDAMRESPAKFRKFDAENGWGTYDDFVPWIQSYLDACRAHPDALVFASR